MKNLQLEVMVLGMMATNCYLVKNKTTGALLIIDPAAASDHIIQKIAERQGTPEAIFLTHGHFDHIGAAQKLREKYGIPIWAQEAEREVLEDPGKNLTQSFGAGGYTLEPDRYLKDEEQLLAAGFEIRVLHTPGHTIGSTCYYFPEEDVLLSGDTLFSCSVGRTDFPTGSMSALHHSLHEKLFLLSDNTEVYPGHGESTTIGYERRYNPY